MKRIARAAALSLLAALALSGCIRYNVDMTLSEDDTASGTIVIAVQKGVGEQMGVANDTEALTQLFGESPFGPNFAPKDYADGDWVGKSYAFDTVPITDLADLASLFTVTRDGDIFSVDGTGAPVTEDERSQMPPGAESKLSITFPGKVIEGNGTIDGRTATWDLFAMTDPIHATADATGPDSGSGSALASRLLIGGGIALAVLVAAFVAVLLILRSRRRAATVNPASLDESLETAPPAIDTPTTPASEQPAPTVAEQPTAAPAEAAPAPKKRAPRVAKPKVEPTAEGDGQE